MLYLFGNNRGGDLVVEATSKEEAVAKAQAYMAAQDHIRKVRDDWYAEHNRRVAEAVGPRDAYSWARENIAIQTIAAEMGYSPPGPTGPFALDGDEVEAIGDIYYAPECI